MDLFRKFPFEWILKNNFFCIDLEKYIPFYRDPVINILLNNLK